MATDTKLDNLIINKLTRSQFDAATKSSTELYVVTDDSVLEQETVLPTASASNEGVIIQYIGATTANYTNGYIYQCQSDGEETPTYSWVQKNVQDGEIPGNGKLTIQKNGTTIAEFTANQTGNTTANIVADSVGVDGTTITKKQNDDLQAIGVLNKNGSTGLYNWKGTLNDYNALATHRSDWIYYIIDDVTGGTSVYTKVEVNQLLHNKVDTNDLHNSTITFTQGGTIKGSFTLNQSNNATIALDAGSGGGVSDVKVNGTSVVTSGVANVSVPTVNNSTISFTQGGVSKGSFTLNQASGTTIALDAGGSSIAIDNVSITTNTEDKIQTVGVIDSKTGNAIKEWTGTLAEYNALSSKDNDTTYYITDDQDEMTSYTKAESDAKYVDLSSTQTITGVKKFTGGLVRKSLAFDETIVPSNNEYSTINIKDKNDVVVGVLGTCHDTADNIYTYIQAGKTINGSHVLGDALQIGITTSGAAFSHAPTPTADSNDTNIATTAWVHSNATGLVVPSSSYISFTVGASGSSYTAPADGWIQISCKTTSDTGNYMSLYNSWLFAPYANWTMTAIQPVEKNKTLLLWFLNTTNMTIRFYYSNGTKPN